MPKTSNSEIEELRASITEILQYIERKETDTTEKTTMKRLRERIN